jgi:hypothetical protein
MADRDFDRQADNEMGRAAVRQAESKTSIKAVVALAEKQSGC